MEVDSPVALDMDKEQELEALKVCHQALKSVKEVEVLVGAEVAKYWRTGDARRENCERVLRMAVAEVEQQLTQLKQACEGNEKNVAEELMAALNCSTQVEVVEAVEDLAIKAAMIDKIEKCTGWEQEEIVVNCKELKKRMMKLLEKEKEVLSLQRELESTRKELQSLKSRKEESMRSGVGTTVPGKAAKEASKIDIEALKRLKHEMSSCKTTLQTGRKKQQELSSSVSIRSRQSSGRTLMKPGELSSMSSLEELSEIDSCGSERMSRGSSQGSISLTENQFGAYLRYVALPDVRLFSGKDKDYSWNNFIESFSLKYPTQNWSSEELKILLKSKLSGEAKTRYEALPHRTRRGSFEGLVAASAETYRVDAQPSRVVALGKLRRLKKAEEQSVADYCVLLERLSAMAYPELDETALMTVRVHQLYEQLVHWPESYHLLVAMEMPGADPYTSLKDTAMRIERRNLTLANTKSMSMSETPSRPSASAAPRTSNVGCEKSRRPSTHGEATQRLRDVEKGRQEKQKEIKTRCYKCQGIGHFARNCSAGLRHVGSKATGVVKLQEDEETMGKSRPQQSETSSFGKKYTTKVEVGGRIWRALLDTGSEISIMPIAVYNLVKASGHICQELPVDFGKRIFDASGNRMKFEMVVKIPVKECDGEQTTVAMHVSQQKGQTLILGTNALPSLGYNLIRRRHVVENATPNDRLKEASNNAEEPASNTRKQQTSSLEKGQSSAVVVKRAYVAPGEDKIVCSVSEVERSEWLRELQNDEDYGRVLESLKANRLDEEVKLSGMTKRLKVADFMVEEGALKLLREDGSAVVVVPKSKRREVFDEAHGGCLAGHFSAKKMCRILGNRVFWETMEKDITKWVRACRKCFLTNPRPTNTPPLKPFVASKPFDCVCADILEMGLSASGMKYILVLVDHFSKWLGAYSMKDKTATSVAEVIFQRWICEGGRWPKQLHTDQGTEFVSEMLDELAKISGIKHTVTKGYNSRENGAAERAIGTLQRILKKKIEVPEMWDALLPNAVFAYNVTPHAGTGESPFFLLYGFDPVIPLNSLPESRVRLSEIDLDDYKTELVRGMRVIRDEVAQQAERYRERMKKYYDDKKAVDKSYLAKVGERVFMRMPRERSHAKHPKLACEWDGPYRVIETSENSALVTKIGVNEDPVRVQFDLLIKCPDEISDEPVESFTRRKRGRKPKEKEKRDSMKKFACGRISIRRDSFFRLENDYDVDSSMHFLHVRFKCDGQSFPSVEGRPGFPLSSCRCSQKITVSDLLPSVPPPAAGERIQCVLDAARVLAIWWGEGSVSCKVQRIMDSSSLALNPKSVAVAYCFFRFRCSHVALMSGMVPQEARFNHTILPGWPWDTSRIIQYGWHMARSMEWSTIRPVVANANEHGRTVILVPDVLRRLTFCRKGPRTTMFYYRSFREVRRNNNVLFANEVGKVVWVMPPREPEDAFSWIQFTAAVDLWLSCGAHVWMVNGPRSCDDGSWNRMNQRARTHILGYLDDHADFVKQWHDLLPEDVGVLKASMACLRVGLVEDPRKWWEVPRAMEFYNHLTRQLKEYGVQLESLKVPKSMKPGGPVHVVDKKGGPPIMDGRISKRHLKRVEKRQEQRWQRELARGLCHLNIRSEDRSSEEGGMLRREEP